MRYQEVHDKLMARLENDLPAWLTYHNVGHTRYVIEHVEMLAAAESIEGNELVILKTAALFHDAGFLQQNQGHEEISCFMAHEMLPDFDYTTSQIEYICRVIMSTQIPQTPEGRLGEIILRCRLVLYSGEKLQQYSG